MRLLVLDPARRRAEKLCETGQRPSLADFGRGYSPAEIQHMHLVVMSPGVDRVYDLLRTHYGLLRALLSQMDTRCRIYPMAKALVLESPSGDARAPIVLQAADHGESFSLAPFMPQQYVDFMMASWGQYGSPKALDARRFICDPLFEEIQHLSMAADNDFDAAVAVSNDGTKIIGADLVVAESCHGWRSFEAVRFRENKLRISPHRCRLNVLSYIDDPWTPQNTLKRLVQGEFLAYQPESEDKGLSLVVRRSPHDINRTDQVLVVVKGGKVTHRVLFTLSAWCPDALEKEGQAVKVFN